LHLGFSLELTQCRQEAANSLAAPKPGQQLSIRVSRYRRHGQLNK